MKNDTLKNVLYFVDEQSTMRFIMYIAFKNTVRKHWERIHMARYTIVNRSGRRVIDGKDKG